MRRPWSFYRARCVRLVRRCCECAALALIVGAFGISCQMRCRPCQPARQPPAGLASAQRPNRLRLAACGVLGFAFALAWSACSFVLVLCLCACVLCALTFARARWCVWPSLGWLADASERVRKPHGGLPLFMRLPLERRLRIGALLPGALPLRVRVARRSLHAPLVEYSLRDVWTCWELWGRQGTFPARGAASTAGSQFTCTWDDGGHRLHRELWVGEVSPAGPHAMCTTPLWSPIDPATTGEHDYVHYVIRMYTLFNVGPKGQHISIGALSVQEAS